MAAKAYVTSVALILKHRIEVSWKLQGIYVSLI